MIGTTPVISGKELTPKNRRLKLSLEHRLNRWFQETGNHIGEAIKGKYKLKKVKKADSDPDGDGMQTELLVGGKRIPKIQSDMIRAMALLGWSAINWREFVAIVQPYLQAAAEEGVDVGLGQVQMTDAGNAQDAANEDAEDYANRRAAEMAGLKWVEVAKGTPDAIERNGKFWDLVKDDNAHWPLTTVMERDIEDSVTQAVEEGWTADQLAAVIDASYALSAERSAIVSDSEITNAQSGGTYSLWRRSGTITLVRWRTADVDRQVDECDDCEAQGVVPLGHEFREGVFSPRLHPFCECELEVVNPNDLQFDGAAS